MKVQVLNSTLTETQAILSKYEEIFNNLPRQTIRYANLQRERMVKEKLYLLIQEKYHEALVNEQAIVGNVTVLEEARIPRLPYKPNRMLIILIGTILGTALVTGVILVRFFLDTTIKTPEEIQKLGYTVLGWIPKVEGLDQFKNELREFITFNRPSSNYAEAFRALRTRIKILKKNKEVKTLLFTSCSPQEGKTFISSNLANTFAQAGRKIVLIDADLRRPRVHKVFGFEKSPGITEYFSNQCELKEIIRKTQSPNLDVVTSGSIPSNPSEILGSVRMERFIEEMKSLYDIIIIDSPPVISVTDAEILSTMVDATMLVVKADHTDKETLKKGLELLSHDAAHFYGTILNNFTIRKEYGAYYKYYYYYYAQKSEKNKREIELE